MAKSSSNLIIGAFILGALALVFLMLMFFSGTDWFTQRERFVMYFDGSVQGLQPGAPVRLKGVQLGEVEDIEVILLPDSRSVVNMVTADLDFNRIRRFADTDDEALVDTVIDAGLRAQLNYQSLLTGLLYIELDFHPGTPPRLLNLQDAYREFPTRQTGIQLIIDEVTQIDFAGMMEDLRELLDNANQVLGSGKVESALDSFQAAARALEDTAHSLELTSRGIDEEMDGIGDNLNESLDRLDQVLDQVSHSMPQLNQEVTQTLEELRDALDTLDAAAVSAEETFSEDSRTMFQVNRAAEDISRAARAMQRLAEMLERRPEALLRGR